MYIGFNNNPSGKRVGDCSVRAISKILGMIWEDAYIALVTEGFKYHDMPSSPYVIGMLLHRHGFQMRTIPNMCPFCTSVEQFANDHSLGKYVLFSQDHVVAVIDGDYYDSWDSGDEIVLYYFEEGDDL